jgi:hypothetical protein
MELKTATRSISSLTQKTTKMNMDSEHSRSHITEEENDTNASLTDFSLEDLEDIPPGFCCWQSKQNSKISSLIAPTPPPQTFVERLALAVKWILWTVTSAFHLYLLIVNIGATMQQNTVRGALPDTFELLYPPTYNIGPVCAWDEGGPNANIQTFELVDKALAANFTVIHCGACGACSW